MPNRTLTPITELDFDGIKQNLKTYLSSTTEFSDYDYEGSGINILLDLLAYNTHYMGVYANMLASESFIDSAVLRRSIVSLAKNLGYVPNSDVAATAVVRLIFGETVGVPASVPVGTQFVGSKDGSDYVFSVVESQEINKNTTPYVVEELTLRQGRFRNVTFVYDPDSNSTIFEIPSSTIDKNILKVFVLKSNADRTGFDTIWQENTNYIELDPTSKVYFINENYRGRYEVSFGDGILGQKPEKGNVIVINYFETDGFAANGIGSNDTADSPAFTFSGIGGDDFNSMVSVVTFAINGAGKESDLSVKYTAPKYYQAQDRAVTLNDYESIVIREVESVSSVRVWGGEDNDPPTYGKVYLSVIPKNGFVFSDAQKQHVVQNVLSNKNLVTVDVEIVDPDFTYIIINANVVYDSRTSSQSESAIKNLVRNAIASYSLTNLGKFNTNFRYSILSRLIDLSTASVVSNRIDTKVAKRLVPLSGANNYTLSYSAEFYHPYDGYQSVISSSIFSHKDSENVVRDCFLEDDGFGNVSMFTTTNGTKTLVKKNIGTVDYSMGKIILVDFAPTSTGSKLYIEIMATPDQKNDIAAQRNQVLFIDPLSPNQINITMRDAATRKV
jgi:hypothetical protein